MTRKPLGQWLKIAIFCNFSADFCPSRQISSDQETTWTVVKNSFFCNVSADFCLSRQISSDQETTCVSPHSSIWSLKLPKSTSPSPINCQMCPLWAKQASSRVCQCVSTKNILDETPALSLFIMLCSKTSPQAQSHKLLLFFTSLTICQLTIYKLWKMKGDSRNMIPWLLRYKTILGHEQLTC